MPNPAVEAVAKAFGPRARFYRTMLELMRSWKYALDEPVDIAKTAASTRKASLDEVLGMAKGTKERLRYIPEELFEDVAPSGPSAAMYLKGARGEYVQTEPKASIKGFVRLNPSSFEEMGTRAPEGLEELKDNLLPHEMAHHIQVSRLGEVQPAKKDLLRKLYLEPEADLYALAIGKRLQGVPKEEVQNWLKEKGASRMSPYLLSLAAALGLGSQLSQPDEAEAGLFSDALKKAMEKGIGTMAKQSKKVLAMGTSSAERAAYEGRAELVGKTVMGKVVKEVKKGPQDWRYLVYEDGTQLPVKKDVIHTLSREFGTQRKLGELAEQDEPSKLIQAIKSLAYHTDRQKTFVTKSMRDDYRKQYIGQMKELNVEHAEMVHIDYPIKAYIPKEYADILEQAGIISIKSRKELVK